MWWQLVPFFSIHLPGIWYLKQLDIPEVQYRRLACDVFELRGTIYEYKMYRFRNTFLKDFTDVVKLSSFSAGVFNMPYSSSNPLTELELEDQEDGKWTKCAWN